MWRCVAIGAFLMAGCDCAEVADNVRYTDERVVSGVVRVHTACSDTCSTRAAGVVRALDVGGVLVGSVELYDAGGQFVLDIPDGSYTLEIAVLGVAVDRGIVFDIAAESGIEIRRTYEQWYVDDELLVLFAAGLTVQQQAAILLGEPGIELLTPGFVDAYYVRVVGHPQLVGESLQRQHPEIVGFELVDIGCPGTG